MKITVAIIAYNLYVPWIKIMVILSVVAKSVFYKVFKELHILGEWNEEVIVIVNISKKSGVEFF
jgi:hypothetical protein